MPVLPDLPEQPHLITVEEYHRMIEAEVFDSDDRFELLDGLLIEMMTEGPPHFLVTSRLAEFVFRGVPDGLKVSAGGGITMRPDSEPQPDFAIWPEGDATWEHKPERARLVIEVSYSSRLKDRARKSRIYARAAVPEYWIVDLVDLCVEVRREPRGDEYTSIDVLKPPAEVCCKAVPLPPLSLAQLFAR